MGNTVILDRFRLKLGFASEAFSISRFGVELTPNLKRQPAADVSKHLKAPCLVLALPYAMLKGPLPRAGAIICDA